MSSIEKADFLSESVDEGGIERQVNEEDLQQWWDSEEAEEFSSEEEGSEGCSEEVYESKFILGQYVRHVNDESRRL